MPTLRLKFDSVSGGTINSSDNTAIGNITISGNYDVVSDDFVDTKVRQPYSFDVSDGESIQEAYDAKYAEIATAEGI